MGIPGFQKWLIGNFPQCVRVQGNRFGQPYDHVAFDMNQILHKSARKAKDRQQLASIIFRELDQVLKSCLPKRSVFFAYDGPGPIAKLLTQRKRRGKNSNKSKASLEQQPQQPGKRKYARPCINGVQFTPGVDMVYFLRDITEYWAYTRLQNDRKYANVDIRISASDVPGEGELKIVDFCRSGLVAKHESIIVVGGDADIVLQGLATIPIRNFFVYLHHATGKGKNAMNHIISVWELVRTLEHMFPKQSSAVRIDFILLAILTGNDYLPKIRGVNLSRLWHRYCRLKAVTSNNQDPPFKHQCAIDPQNRTFNWPMLYAIINNLGVPLPPIESTLQSETSTLDTNSIQLASNMQNPLSFTQHNHQHHDTDDSEEDPGDVILYTGNEDGVFMSEIEGQNQYDTMKQNLQNVGDMAASSMTVAASLSGSDDDISDESEIDEDNDEEDEDYDEDNQHIENLVAISGSSKRFYDTERWFRVVLWTIHMYIDGFCSDYMFQYGKPYGPSCDVIAKYIRDYDGTPFTVQAPVSNASPLLPHEAALAMLPKQCADLLPTPLRPLVNDPSLSKKIFLPRNHVDVDALIEAVAKIPKSAYQPHELERTVLGNPFMLCRQRGNHYRPSFNQRVPPPGPKFPPIRERPIILRSTFRMTQSSPCFPWPSGYDRGTLVDRYVKVGGHLLTPPKRLRPSNAKPAAGNGTKSGPRTRRRTRTRTLGKRHKK